MPEAKVIAAAAPSRSASIFSSSDCVGPSLRE